MTHTGGESATSGFREQTTWQLRAARVLTDLPERSDIGRVLVAVRISRSS